MKIYDTYRIIMIHFLITHINTLCSNIEHNWCEHRRHPNRQNYGGLFLHIPGRLVECFPKSDQRKQYPSKMSCAACFVSLR